MYPIKIELDELQLDELDEQELELQLDDVADIV